MDCRCCRGGGEYLRVYIEDELGRGVGLVCGEYLRSGVLTPVYGLGMGSYSYK